jgi:hypothetical protein
MRQRERRRAWVRVAGIEFCRRQTRVESRLAVPAGREEGGEGGGAPSPPRGRAGVGDRTGPQRFWTARRAAV